MKFPKIKLKKISKKQIKIYRKRSLYALVCIIGIVLVFWGLKQWTIQQEQQAFKKADHTQFIQIVGKTASSLASQNDLYASVMVAQAILESDWGQSTLTKEANNLFGIKGSYEGESYEIATQEDDGTGTMYTVMAEFRKYPTYHKSLADNAALLSGGVSWDSNYYSGAWRSKTSSYEEATAALQGTYATDTSYASKLNNLIEQYNLTQFDE